MFFKIIHKKQFVYNKNKFKKYIKLILLRPVNKKLHKNNQLFKLTVEKKLSIIANLINLEAGLS